MKAECDREKARPDSGNVPASVRPEGDDYRAKAEVGEKRTEETKSQSAEAQVPGGADSADIKFRKRKRSRKIRTKHNRETEREKGSDDDARSEINRAELILMKEAQLLREQGRVFALDVRVEKAKGYSTERDDGEPQAPGDEVVGGLKDSFAVERSSVAVVERMDKFIEEGMRQKFGEKDEDHSQSQVNDSDHENDLYAIPERLQVNQRPMYDPGEGLPAAGVEEVELPSEVRERNIAETVLAHKKLLAGKRSRDQNTDVQRLPGNLSANFAKHRKDWISDRVSLKYMGQDEAYRPEKGELQDFDRKQDDSDRGNSNALKRRRSFQVASDSLLVERFRKRWRR